MKQRRKVRRGEKHDVDNLAIIMRFLPADLFIHLLALPIVHSFLHDGVLLGLAPHLARGGALSLGHGLAFVLVDSLIT